jgi:photosystem II stability/assembly factor-like uncharacterized protein
MKKSVKPFIVAMFFGIVFSSQVMSQKYLDMMEDKAYNVYDVVEEAETYFNEHNDVRGGIWKRYQRWRAWAVPYFYPSGDRTKFDPVALRTELDKFNNRQYLKSAFAGEWKELGPFSSNTYNGTGSPAPGVGRIDKPWINPLDVNHLRAGTNNGGLWESKDGGATWQLLTEGLISPKAQGFAVDPANANIIYMGIADGRGYAADLLKSTDGGQSWMSLAPTGVDPDVLTELFVHTENSSILYAYNSDGVYKSVDGGSQWKSLNIPAISKLRDLELKPDNPEVLYLAAAQPTNARRNLYRSTDGGENWSTIEVLSSIPAKRTWLAVTPADPNCVYFVNETEGVGIWKSTDAGDSFVKFGEAPGSYMSVGVSDTDPDIILYGTPDAYVWDKVNGDFKQVTKYNEGLVPGNPYEHAYVHADIRGIICHNGIFYIGTDGYLAKSSNNGATWQRISNGIAVREFTSVTWSKKDPNLMVGASQDNGLSLLNGSNWLDYAVGDGIKAYFDHQNTNIIYGVTARGFCYKTIDKGKSLNWSFTQPGWGHWFTPFIMDPDDGKTLYIGLSEVRKTTDGMSTWTTISDFGSLNAYDYVTELAVAESDGKTLFAAKGSRLWKSTNGGSTWSQITNVLPNAIISAIAIHPSDKNKIALSYAGTVEGEKVYFSSNGGSSWENYSGDLPNSSVNHIIFQNVSSDRMYITFDGGMYYRDTDTPTWTLYSNNLPATRLYDMDINETTSKIRVATYGRGLWEAPLVNNEDSSISDYLSESNKVSAYFNSGNSIKIRMEELPNGIYHVNVLDIKGRVVKSEIVEVFSYQQTEEVTLSSKVVKGMYLVTVSGKENKYIAKCIR